MKNTANVITSLRIVFAVAMLFAAPFSFLFWICYLCAGLSDVLDGIAARMLKQQSEFGAKFDSAADLIFGCAIAAVVILNIEIPIWLWICAAGIALLRFVGYGIGYNKYRTFSALHTYANKAAGGMIFILPLLNALLGIETSGLFLCAVAFASALEEALITARANELDRDCKSAFSK